jgi:hypothetical protein
MPQIKMSTLDKRAKKKEQSVLALLERASRNPFDLPKLVPSTHRGIVKLSKRRILTVKLGS